MSEFVERVKKYVGLMREAKRLNDEAEAAKADASELEAVLREEFAAAGMQNMTVDGAVVFLHRQLWANAESGKMPDLCKALKARGDGALVKEAVNTQTLSAYAREFERNADDLPIIPEGLEGLIRCDDRITVRVKEAG